MASTLSSCGKKTDKQDTRGVFQRKILQKPADMWHGRVFPVQSLVSEWHDTDRTVSDTSLNGLRVEKTSVKLNISINILHTLLDTFPLVLTWRIP